MGRLEVITGPMFSGKSEEMIRRLRREEIAGRTIKVLKPSIDNRFDEWYLVSHSGHKFPSECISKVSDITDGPEQVLAIDEVQFLTDLTQHNTSLFRFAIADRIRKLASTKIVIVSGLDTDFRGIPFGPMGELLCIADRVDKLHAVCHVCKSDATMTQRLINGEPATMDGPTVLVGGLESYEARCKGCHAIIGINA